MKASSRFLVISGVAIGVLVVVTVVLVLTVGDGGSATLLPEATPEGVVQRYLLAINNGDYEEAYSYLSSAARAEESYQSWVRPLDSYYAENHRWKATLGESSVVGRGATVEVRFTYFRPSGPFVIDPVPTRLFIFYLEKEESS